MGQANSLENAEKFHIFILVPYVQQYFYLSIHYKQKMDFGLSTFCVHFYEAFWNIDKETYKYKICKVSFSFCNLKQEQSVRNL